MDAVTIHVGKEPRYSMHKTPIINLKSYLKQLSETTTNHKVFLNLFLLGWNIYPVTRGTLLG